MEIISNVVDSVNNIIWESFIKTPWLILVLLFVFILWLYLFVSMRLWNLSQKVEKQIIYEYDNILYLWSEYYYNHLDSLQTNPWIIVLKSVLKSWTSQYIPNKNLIKNTILKIEDRLWEKAISDQEWQKLDKLLKKLRIRRFFSILLKTIIVLIIIFLLLLALCLILGK